MFGRAAAENRASKTSAAISFAFEDQLTRLLKSARDSIPEI
jgi:hypothetical protein